MTTVGPATIPTWWSYAKSIMTAVVAAAATFVSAQAADRSMPVTVTMTVVALAVGLGASWAHQTPAMKLIIAVVTAGGGAFLASWGHATTQQVIISVLAAVAAGGGLTGSTSNDVTKGLPPGTVAGRLSGIRRQP